MSWSSFYRNLVAIVMVKIDGGASFRSSDHMIVVIITYNLSPNGKCASYSNYYPDFKI